MLTTTISELRKHGACMSGLKTLLASLPGDDSINAPITLAHILESNGLDHAIWALRTQDKKYAVQFAKLCVERVKKYTADAAEAAAEAAYAVNADAAADAAGYAADAAADAAGYAADAARYAADAADDERKEQEKIYLEIVSNVQS